MSMTALVSAFARAYHAERNGAKIYEDKFARSLLSRDEYAHIAEHMTAGVSFFDPAFRGSDAEALRRIVDGFLSPAPLVRAAFAAEKMVESGASQLLVLASGYDTFCYDCGLPVFELDRAEVLSDKQARLLRAGIPSEHVCFVPADLSGKEWPTAVKAAGLDPIQPTFCTIMGLSYYLSASEMTALLQSVSALLSPGSRIVLDVPTAPQTVQGTLAAGAGEPMRTVYDHAGIERVLGSCGLILQNWLTADDMQLRYFDAYNSETPDCPMFAPSEIALALIEKV